MKRLTACLRPGIECLEPRENPSTIVSTENFDQSTSLPSGWGNWSSDGQPQFMTTKYGSYSGNTSLASLGHRTVTSRFWNPAKFGAEYGAAAVIRSDTPTGIEVIARGSDLGTATPSYVAAVYKTNGSIELVEVNAGVRKSLGTITPATGVPYGVWLKVSLKPVGEWAGVTLQRLDTGNYLGTDGKWSAVENEAIRLKTTIRPADGYLGIGRISGGSGMALLDDLSVLAPPGVNESFSDTTRIGKLPAGWQSWSNDGLNRIAVGVDRVISTNALSADGASTTLSRAWVDQSFDPNMSANVSIYSDNLIPSGLIVRGSNLNTATPTYYSLTVSRGLTITLNKVVNGVQTELAKITSKSWVSGEWIKLTLNADGDKLTATVYRVDKAQWLGADGYWKDAPESALERTDASIRTGGFVGVERGKLYSGKVWFDNFEMRPASAVVGPTVTITSNQSQYPFFSKTVAFTANAVSPSATITRIEFYLNGILRSSQNAGSAVWELDTTTIANARHELIVRAIDSAGNAGTSAISMDVNNGVLVNANVRPTTPQKYSHIRVAMLAYSGNPAGAFEQALAQSSIDLIVPNPRLLGAFESAVPNTPKVIYTNVSNLYSDILLDWNRYADAKGISRELAFYHVTKASAFSGNSPSSIPVNWFWAVQTVNLNGTGAINDQTSASRGNRAPGVSFGTVGQATSISYPEKFQELNFVLNKAAASDWKASFEYVASVNADGTPATWKTLNLKTDGTSGFATSGRVTFDPPADWVSARGPGAALPTFLIRVKPTSGTVLGSPIATTILGRDYVNANGGTTGTIPAYDSQADLDKDGYLNDTEYAKRRAGFDARFTYESRLFYPVYGQQRFITNPGTTAIREWAVDYHKRLLVANPTADGIFVDNAHAKLPFSPATTPVIESTTSFSEDAGTLVGAVTRALPGKWVVSNTAGSIVEADSVTRNSSAAFEEFLLRPNDVNWSNFNDVASLVARRITADAPAPYVILDSYSGSQSYTTERSRMGTLSYYYLLADPNKTFLSLFGGQAPSAAWNTTWIPAIGTSVGKPTAAFTTWATGTDPQNAALTYKIYGRTYENALTLFKPRSYTIGKGTGTTDNATATTHALGGNYRVLNSDGTLGPVITSITLRNGEGVVLIKA